MALRLPGLQPVHTVARTRDLPRRPGASPRWRYAYRGDSRCHTVAGQGIYPAARESLPGGATLTGATAGAHRSPGKGFTPPPGNLSPVALRLPGRQPVHTVARTRDLPRCPGRNRFVGQVRRSRHLAKNGHHGAPGYSTSSSHFCAGVRRLAVSGFNQSRWSCCALSWRSMYKPCSTRLLLPVILQVPPCQVCAL